MRKIDIMLILASLFVLRIIVFSAGYADSICLLTVFGFIAVKEYLQVKKISNNILESLKRSEELTGTRFEQLSQEIVKVRNNNEAIKAAVNFNKR
jgi:hypothetical protein